MAVLAAAFHFSRFGIPAARIRRGQAMDEAIHFPGLAALPIGLEDGVHPAICRALALGELERLLNAVFIAFPEHLEDTLLPKRETFSVGIREQSGRARRPELPQISREDDANATEGSLSPVASCVRVSLACTSYRVFELA